MSSLINPPGNEPNNLPINLHHAFDAEMAEEIRACADLSALLDEKMNRLKRRIDADPQNERNRMQSELDRIHSMMGDLPAPSDGSKGSE